jgi:hypothetical protein
LACVTYLTATRQFDQYLKDSDTRIETVTHETGAHAIPVVDSRGQLLWQALEAASAGLLFVDVSSDTVEQAQALRTALLRLAAARASCRAGEIPDGPVLSVLSAEQAFLHSARADLQMTPVDGILRTMRAP